MFKSKKLDEQIFFKLLRSGEVNDKQKLKKILRSNYKTEILYSLNINWDYVCEYDNLSVGTIKMILLNKNMLQKFSFKYLSKNKKLTSNHLFCFKEKLDWNIISKNFTFCLNDYEMFKNYINWRNIFFYKNLTLEIVIRYRKYFEWLFLSKEKDYEKYNNIIYIKAIGKLDEKFIDEYNKKLDEYYHNHCKLNEILVRNITQLTKDYCDNKNITYTDPTIITSMKKINKSITDKMSISTNTEEVLFNTIGVNTECIYEILEDLSDDITEENLTEYNRLSEELDKIIKK
jgi:hypothetical protein